MFCLFVWFASSEDDDDDEDADVAEEDAYHGQVRKDYERSDDDDDDDEDEDEKQRPSGHQDMVMLKHSQRMAEKMMVRRFFKKIRFF